MFKKLNIDKKFYKKMSIIAIPVVIQNFIAIGLNMVDSIMIGKLGVDPLASVGIANRLYFIFTMICFGLFSGSSIFIAQYWGIKNIKDIRKIFGLNIYLGSIISIIISIIIFIFPYQILSLFCKDSIVVSQGVEYLRIIVFSYIFTSLSYAASFDSRAIQKLTAPTIISAIAILVNTLLNYVLIYGKFGFPRLEIKGAAIATFIARAFEFITLYAYIYLSKEHPLAASIKELSSFNGDMFKNLISKSLPVIISESSWAIGTSIYYIAYGILGPSAIAVVNVAYIINDLFQSIFFGIGNATAVMIGNEIGKNKLKRAIKYSRNFIKITFILNIIVSISLILFSNTIVKIYDFDIVTSIMLKKSLIVFAIFTTPKMFTYVFICGILRSGGDTKFPMFIEIITIWFISIPLAFLSVKVFKLPLHLVLVVVFSEEILKLFIIVKRYNTRKWLRNVISS